MSDETSHLPIPVAYENLQQLLAAADELAELKKPVHLVGFSDHTSAQLLCTGKHHGHPWGKEGEPIRKASPLGGGLYRLEGGIVFTHSDPCATCEQCIAARFATSTKEQRERTTSLHRNFEHARKVRKALAETLQFLESRERERPPIEEHLLAIVTEALG